MARWRREGVSCHDHHMASPPDLNLLSPSTFADGHPVELYRWLQENDPVHWHEEPGGSGFWAVTGFEDVRRVGREHETFSSEPTIMISDPADPADDPDASAILGDHKMMLMADPPYHTRLRRLISSDFTPRNVRQLSERIESLATDIVDEVIERGECDLVTDLAGEMPSYLIADLMGLPLEDGRELYKLTEILHSSGEAVTTEDRRQAQTDMFTYAAEVYGKKQLEPGEDLSTTIINAEVEGEKLDVIDFALFFMLLVDAGGDTTRNLVSGGMLELFRDHGQLRALQADPDGLLPNAIEEMLRFVSPVIYMRRTATTATTLGDQAIAAGDKVVMYYGAANRDASVFADPNRFDIGRANAADHIAFGGGGPHFCLGANLARLEIDALFREMLRRLPDMELVGPAPYLSSNFISGPVTMPVRFSPGARSAA